MKSTQLDVTSICSYSTNTSRSGRNTTIDSLGTEGTEHNALDGDIWRIVQNDHLL